MQPVLYTTVLAYLFFRSSILNKITDPINIITATHTALAPISDVNNPPEIAPAKKAMIITEYRTARRADFQSLFVKAI